MYTSKQVATTETVAMPIVLDVAPRPDPKSGISVIASFQASNNTSHCSKGRFCCLERNVSLSQSIIWKMQKNYYISRGLDAWNLENSVVDPAAGTDIRTPFYSTSNIGIATAYAQVVFSRILESINSGQINSNFPVYIIELGSGHGVFSGKFASRLQGLFDSICTRSSEYNIAIRKIRVVLVLTDVNVKEIISLLRSSDSSLSRFCVKRPFCDVNQMSLVSDDLCSDNEQNVFVDCAEFNAEIDCAIHLIHAEVNLAPIGFKQSKNAIFIAANYIFDSLRADAFKLMPDLSLNEGLSTMYYSRQASDYDNDCVDIENLSSLDLGKCHQDWNYEKKCFKSDCGKIIHYSKLIISIDGLGNISDLESSFLDLVLNAFVDKLKGFTDNVSDGIYFTFPAGAILCLLRIQKWSVAGDFILLAADKTANSIENLVELSYPPVVALHGSLSLTVNFVALTSLFDILNTDYETMYCHTPHLLCDVDVFLAVVSSYRGFHFSAAESIFQRGFFEMGSSDIMIVRRDILESYSSSYEFWKQRIRCASDPSCSNILSMTYSDDDEAPSSTGNPQFPSDLVQALFVFSGFDPDIIEQFNGVIITDY